MRLLIDRCVNCLCRVCTKHYCPYCVSRCDICIRNKFSINIDCDYFENIKIAPKRLKVKLKSNKQSSEINLKLDLILSNMGLIAPVIELSGTFDIIWRKISIARFYNRSDAELFIKKYQNEFTSKLQIKRVEIDM